MVRESEAWISVGEAMTAQGKTAFASWLRSFTLRTGFELSLVGQVETLDQIVAWFGSVEEHEKWYQIRYIHRPPGQPSEHRPSIDAGIARALEGTDMAVIVLDNRDGNYKVDWRFGEYLYAYWGGLMQQMSIEANRPEGDVPLPPPPPPDPPPHDPPDPPDDDPPAPDLSPVSQRVDELEHMFNEAATVAVDVLAQWWPR